MRRFAIPFLLLLSAPAAFAGQIRCTGSYWPYSIEARTRSTGTALSAPIMIYMNGPFGSKHTSRFDAVTSDVRVGQYIHVQAKGPEGEGDLSATFTGGSTYSGTLTAQTTVGNAAVQVTCQMTNPWHFFGL